MKLSRLLCFLGFHSFRLVEKTGSFGSGGVEKVQCQRCGLVITRQG
jgi:hypothetical protein